MSARYMSRTYIKKRLPMNEIYTKVKNNNTDAENCPKQRTIDFLKQFARICAYERMLNANMGSFPAN